MKRVALSRLAAIAAWLAIGSCRGADSTGPVVASVSITPGADTIFALGVHRQLVATVLDGHGNPVTGIVVAWSSSQPAVATVDAASGLVTAVGNGQAHIAASAAGIAGGASILVSQVVATVTVTPPSGGLTAVGATQQFTAVARDSNNATVAGERFVWLSSDPSVATIDTAGLAKARRSGQVTVTAAARGVPGYATLSVNQAAALLAFRVGPPASTVAGEAFANAVQVEIRDAGGALVPDAQLPVSLTGSGPALHGTTTVNAISGVASFSGLWVETTGSGLTLSASTGALPQATSGAFAITPAAPVAVVFASAPHTDTAGARLGVVARIRDRFGNTVTGATDSVRLRLALTPAGGAAISGDSVVAAVAGVAAFTTANLHTASPTSTADYSMRAVAAGLDSVLSVPFGVTPASPRSVKFEGTGFYGFANTPPAAISAQFQVSVRDTFLNLVKTGSHPVSLSLTHTPYPPATIYGAVTRTSALGYATFDSAIVDRPAGSLGYGLQAVAPGLRPDTAVFNVFLRSASVVAGGDNACVWSGFLGATPSLFCWGANGSGQLGNTTHPLTADSAPVLVSGSQVPTAQFGAGLTHACMLDASGLAYCWGANDHGQLGSGAPGGTSPTPAAVSGGRVWSRLAVGGSHVCAIAAADSTAYCWGANGQGQLGDADAPNDRSAPMAVSGGRKYIAITAGLEHTCALAAADTTAYCWGRGDHGELGYGGFGGDAVPVPVINGYRFASLSAGNGFTCGIRRLKNGTNVYCWGVNDVGQLGDGNAGTNRPQPDTVRYAGLGVSEIAGGNLAAGGTHACVAKAAPPQHLLCWGGSADGQVGPNGGIGSAVPVVAISGTEFSVGQIAAGAAHTCVNVLGSATGAGIGIWCWGRNTSGQLGDGSTAGGSTPRMIVQ